MGATELSIVDLLFPVCSGIGFSSNAAYEVMEDRWRCTIDFLPT